MSRNGLLAVIDQAGNTASLAERSAAERRFAGGNTIGWWARGRRGDENEEEKRGEGGRLCLRRSWASVAAKASGWAECGKCAAQPQYDATAVAGFSLEDSTRCKRKSKALLKPFGVVGEWRSAGSEKHTPRQPRRVPPGSLLVQLFRCGSPACI
jgi:hypothetical protein